MPEATIGPRAARRGRRPVLALLGVLVAVAGACTRGGEETGPAEDLVKLSRAADAVAYRAEYTYTLMGPLSRAVSTKMLRVRVPPNDLRRIEVTTTPDGGEPVSVTAWYVRKDGQSYSCTDYDEVDCRVIEGRRGVFGFDQVDQLIEASRTEDGFRSVAEGSPKTIAGEEATCFDVETVPRTSQTPAPSVTPRYDPDEFEVELCYASDGILLRAHQKATGPVPSGSNRLESILEAQSVSRNVDDADTDLPGPVTDLGPTVSPAATPRATASTTRTGAPSRDTDAS